LYYSRITYDINSDINLMMKIWLIWFFI